MSAPATRLILVRHGETDYNRDDRWQGAGSDRPLNDHGRAQIERVAGRLAEPAIAAGLDALYASDLVRARESADILARRLDLAVRLEAGLRELDHGAFEGLTKTEARSRYPEAHAAILADPHGAPRPGGDSYSTLGERLWPAIDRIVRAHRGGRALVVTHGGPISLLLSRALARSLAERAEFGVVNGAWFELEERAGEWRVLDG